jgi:alkaline phosphatase D
VQAPDAPRGSAFTLAFGSCSKPDLAQPLWGAVLRHEPAAFAWLGDIVYTPDARVDLLPELYATQSLNPGYAALRRATRVVGIWDDHDYGLNDGGKDFAGREPARTALLDFLGEPPESPRRTRSGVYASYTLGEGAVRAKLILLDTRSQRDPAGASADVLGEEQWAFLERELTDRAASIHLIASSIQVLPFEHPYEKWERYPRAKARLFEVFARSGASGIVLLSGDRHLAELSCSTVPGLRYPLFELTSSGMTHSYTTVGDEPNSLRVGNLYSELNFGLVRVDPERRLVILAVRGVADTPAFEHVLRLDDLGIDTPAE